MSYFPTIFPELAGARWAMVDLGDIARRDFVAKESYRLVDNPLLDSGICDAWVRSIAKEMGADFTWGGHFEDRQHLWRGYYVGARALTHLGVDYNVPAGTKVSVPRSCTVVHSWADTSTENGWGGRIIVKLATPWRGADYLLYGHLAHAGLAPVGAQFGAHAIIGVTGQASENGGWFPHLHVQCVTEEMLKLHAADLRLLDGYYVLEGEPHRLAPNPALLVGSVDESSDASIVFGLNGRNG